MKSNHLLSSQDISRIDILLSTYQGAEYLEALLDSLVAQSYPHWRLIIRDDGSSDQTRVLIERFVQQHPKQALWLDSESGRLGCCASFATLLSAADAPYLMFCDQDDIWLPEKIALTLDAMHVAELNTPTTPLLVHTDLKVVNRDLQIIASSFWAYAKLNPDHAELHQLLVQNVITGNTLMINQATKQLALPIPEAAIMHDWWLALIGAAFGKIIAVKQPTILYRQHSHNAIGAKTFKLQKLLQKLLQLNAHRFLLATQRQASAFGRQFESLLDQEIHGMIFAYSNLGHYNFIKKLALIFTYKFYANSLSQNLSNIVSFLLMK